MNALNLVAVFFLLILLFGFTILLKKILNSLHILSNISIKYNEEVNPLISIKVQAAFLRLRNQLKENNAVNLINNLITYNKYYSFKECLVESFKRTHFLISLIYKLIGGIQNSFFTTIQIAAFLLSLILSFGFVLILDSFISNELLIPILSSIISFTISETTIIILEVRINSKLKDKYNEFCLNMDEIISISNRKKGEFLMKEGEQKNEKGKIIKLASLNEIEKEEFQININYYKESLKKMRFSSIEHNSQKLSAILFAIISFSIGFTSLIIILNLISNSQINKIFFYYGVSVLIDIIGLRFFGSISYSIVLYLRNDFILDQSITEISLTVEPDDYEESIALFSWIENENLGTCSPKELKEKFITFFDKLKIKTLDHKKNNKKMNNGSIHKLSNKYFGKETNQNEKFHSFEVDVKDENYPMEIVIPSSSYRIQTFEDSSKKQEEKLCEIERFAFEEIFPSSNKNEIDNKDDKVIIK